MGDSLTRHPTLPYCLPPTRKVTLGKAKVCHTDTGIMKAMHVPVYGGTRTRYYRVHVHRGTDTAGILFLLVLVFHSTRTQVKVLGKTVQLLYQFCTRNTN